MSEGFSLDSLLRDKKRVAVSGHVRPDGDCIGSCLALASYIRENEPQIEVDVYLESSLDRFSYLTGFDTIRRMPKKKPDPYDLFLAVDCADLARLGKTQVLLEEAGMRVCIDHHVSNGGYGDINYIVGGASSTCELIYETMDPKRISKETAACLYTGIVTDTGVFQYASTSMRTMEIAGMLMATGIDYPGIVQRSFFAMRLPELRIKGHAMLSCTRHLNGRCMVSILTMEDLKRYGAEPKDLEGIASELRNTEGIEAVIFLHENRDGTYKLSLRSGSIVDVSGIAVEFGGGGHVRAAGATIYGSVTEARDKLLARIREQLEAAGEVIGE